MMLPRTTAVPAKAKPKKRRPLLGARMPWETKPHTEAIPEQGRYATVGTCRWCGVDVITGYDDSRAALWVTLDMPGLSHAGALAAAITGRVLYRLTEGNGQRPQIDWAPVLPHLDRSPYWVDHQCDRPPQARWLARYERSATPTPVDSKVPF